MAGEVAGLTRSPSEAAKGIVSRLGSEMWYWRMSLSEGRASRPSTVVPSTVARPSKAALVGANSVMGFGLQSTWLGSGHPESNKPCPYHKRDT